MIGSELLSDRVEASRGMETVQVASRAVPVLGPTAEQGVRAAMEDQGSWGIFFLGEVHNLWGALLDN